MHVWSHTYPNTTTVLPDQHTHPVLLRTPDGIRRYVILQWDARWLLSVTGYSLTHFVNRVCCKRVPRAVLILDCGGREHSMVSFDVDRSNTDITHYVQAFSFKSSCFYSSSVVFFVCGLDIGFSSLIFRVFLKLSAEQLAAEMGVSSETGDQSNGCIGYVLTRLNRTDGAFTITALEILLSLKKNTPRMRSLWLDFEQHVLNNPDCLWRFHLDIARRIPDHEVDHILALTVNGRQLVIMIAVSVNLHDKIQIGRNENILSCCRSILQTVLLDHFPASQAVFIGWVTDSNGLRRAMLSSRIADDACILPSSTYIPRSRIHKLVISTFSFCDCQRENSRYCNGLLLM